MKLIHCADLHLDSKLSANLEKEKAKERKGEILHTFERMVHYAEANDVEAILIAGDMFDTKSISKTTRNTVLLCITTHPDIEFYYLKGNHDRDNFLSGLEEIPENLKLFETAWTTYHKGNVEISGIELNSENKGTAELTLILDSKKFNIVMMHGQEHDEINLRELKNKGIDYLALGHIHAYKKEAIDARGTYCYPGCLDGRGFDECGEHGFVLLEVDEEKGTYSHEFIPFASRQLYTVEVDVSGCDTSAQMGIRIGEALQEAECQKDSLVKIVLKGTVDVECEKDLEYLLARWKKEFYFVKIYDETTWKIEVRDYMLDESLKGEFVRIVMQDASISEDEKKSIVRYGLQAISGEEVQ